MKNISPALKATIPYTLPILPGFLFLGAAYGALMVSSGFSVFFTIAASVFVFAGSLQFLAAELLLLSFNPAFLFLMALMLNARHLFYGISLLEKFKGTGKFKPYLIFALCDETFSVLVSANPPETVDKGCFMFFITLLNQGYWILGTALGAVLGNFIPFDLTGIDFALTALFAVIFINQWKESKNHFPAIIGIFCSIAALVIFGAESFIIPAMVFILVFLGMFSKKIEGGL